MQPDSSVFTPQLTLPIARDLPPEIQALIERLSEPFPITELRIRPGQVRRDGTAAQALPYAEWWTSYQPRLDSILGRANWRIQLIPWGSDSIIARMSVFGGLIERDSTGSSKETFEGGQDAEAQALKRVCARTVGLGLYLYFLPEVWGRGERDGKRFYFAGGEEERCLHELYRRAGLSTIPHPGVSLPSSTPPTPAPTVTTSMSIGASSSSTPSTPHSNGPAVSTNTRLVLARTALTEAERHAGVTSGPRRTTVPSHAALHVGRGGAATERQRAAIVRLVAQALRDGQQPSTVNRVGQEQAGLTGLSGITRPELLPATLSSPQASALISALQGLLR